MANFWRFNGSEERRYPSYQLTADPGFVYDFGAGTVPNDGRWVSDPGPATAPPPPVLPGVVASGPQQGQVPVWDATSASYKPANLLGVRVPTVPAANLVVEDPYSLAASFTHPDVLNIPAGWGRDSNGKAWKYWMANTPYWHGEAVYENPCIFVSDDGIVWQTPAGMSNPIDPKPATASAYNSDPDLFFAGSTLHIVYRQHDTSSGLEAVMHRSSTDGITWSAETTLFDSTGLTPANRLNMISPTVAYDGSQYHMYYSRQGNQIMHRTSADGLTWGTESVVSLPTYPGNGFSHLDVVWDGTKFHLLTQDMGNPSNSQVTNGQRKLWLGKSTDGATFTYGANPFLSSEGFAQRMIYRSSILPSKRNGKDYYDVWVSGASYTLDTSTAGQTADVANSGTESWYIGHTQGYDPNDLPTLVASIAEASIYPAGDIVTSGVIKATEVGASRFFARVAKAARGIFDRLHAVEMTAQAALFSGPPSNLDAESYNDWVTRLGYSQVSTLNRVPALVVSSDPLRTDALGSVAALDIHNEASDTAKPITDYWRIRVAKSGGMDIQHYDTASQGASPGLASILSLDFQNGITAHANLFTDAGKIVIVGGDRVRLSTAKTPTSSADSYGAVGDICRDDNYIYVKTSTGWKRSALLSTF